MANTSYVVDFDNPKDCDYAATTFSEGNEALRKLLLNCYSKRIIIKYCCAGEPEKPSHPYLAFSYSPTNMPYINNIIGVLSETNYSFMYSKLDNNDSFFSIRLDEDFTVQDATRLFEQLDDIISSTDKNKDYSSFLPNHMQQYVKLIEVAENDPLLKTDKKDNGFVLTYSKDGVKYEYSIFTNDSYYNTASERCGFHKRYSLIPSYSFATDDRELAAINLNKLIVETNTIDGKSIEIFNSQNQDKRIILGKLGKMGIVFEDNNISGNNQLLLEPGDTVIDVANKLAICRQCNIKAFAIFNTIKLNNWDLEGREAIIQHFFNPVAVKKDDKNKQTDSIIKQAYDWFLTQREKQRQKNQLRRRNQLSKLNGENVENMESNNGPRI